MMQNMSTSQAGDTGKAFKQGTKRQRSGNENVVRSSGEVSRRGIVGQSAIVPAGSYCEKHRQRLC